MISVSGYGQRVAGAETEDWNKSALEIVKQLLDDEEVKVIVIQKGEGKR